MTRRRGLIDRLADGYGDPAGSMRRLLADRPSEATLLSLLLLAALIGFVGRSFVAFGALAAAPEPLSPDLFRAELAAELVGALFFAPLAVYALSAVVRALGRALGGEGDWYECRAACVWSALLAAPVLAVAQGAAAVATAQGVVGAVAGVAGAVDSLAAGAVAGIGLAAALYGGYLWAGCVAAAHGAASPWRLYGVTVGVLAVGLALAGLASGAPFG